MSNDHASDKRRGGRGCAGQFIRYPSHQRKVGVDSKEAAPALIYGPSNNWVEFSKRITIYAGEKYGVLSSITKERKCHSFSVPTDDCSITDDTTRQVDHIEAIKLRIKDMNVGL